MPPQRLIRSPADLEKVRRLYVETKFTSDEIAERSGISRRTLYGLVKEHHWPKRSEMRTVAAAAAGIALAAPDIAGAEAADPLRLSPDGPLLGAASHAGLVCPGLADCPERPRLVRRLWNAAEREIAATERYLAQSAAGRPPDAAAKRLGALAATLDRLVAIDRKAVAARSSAPGDADDGAVMSSADIERWARRVAGKLGGDDEGEAGGAEPV